MACNVSTRCMEFLLTSIGLLLLTSVYMGKAGSLRCPPTVRIEIGIDGVIACDIGFAFVNLYWYSGDSFSETPPIVKLEDGTTVGGDGFDISTNGTLIVLDADASREGIYTIVVFHRNGSYVHSRVFLKTFANPTPYFPLIERCKGNQSCSLKADYKGSVQCAIHGARPAFEIDLESNGVTLINATYRNVTDATTGLTNTSLKAYYESKECVHLANITCIATGNTNDKIKSTLTFHDDCRPIIPTDAAGKGSAGVAVVIILVFIVIIVVAVVVTIYFMRRQGYQRVQKNDGEVKTAPLVTKYENEYAKISQEEKGDDTKIKLSVKDHKEILLQALSEKYRESYFGNTSNEDDRIISIDDVYFDLDFEIINGSDKDETFKIDKMLTAPFTTDQKRRTFVSNKMQLTFSNYFAYLWSQKTTKDNILLVFNMLDVPYNNNIVTAIKEMLQDQFSVTEDDLVKVIKKFGCHIIFEGVEAKDIVSENENEASSEFAAHGDVEFLSKLTLGNILRDNRRKSVPKNIFQWVIIYDRESVTPTHDKTYEVVLIKDITIPFMDNFDGYIDTVVDYYCRSSSDEKKKNITAVQEVISQGELRKKFEKAPVMLMQMTHLVTKTCLNNSETLAAEGISSLLMKSMNLLKMRYQRKCPSQKSENLTCLEEQLGEVAHNQMIGKANKKQNVSQDVMKFSKSIGLIKPSTSADIINFPAEYVKYFLTACFMKDKETVSSFIDQTIQSDDDANNDQRFQILSFICALQPSYSHQICEKTLKTGRMKYFLNCFCEAGNTDEFHTFIKKYVEKDDFVISVYDNKPHLAKVNCLLKYCCKWEITVRRIQFDRISQTSSRTTVVKTEAFEMPVVERIIFNRLQLNEEDTFIYYVEWLVRQKVKIVSFDNCRLPELSSDVKFTLKDIFRKSPSKIAFKKTDTEDDIMHKWDLNKEEMKWIPKGTEKINKKKDKDTKGGHHDKDKVKGRSNEGHTVEKQTKNNETTDQAPSKPPRVKSTDNTPGSIQPGKTADVTVNVHQEPNKGNNNDPLNDQTLNEIHKSISFNASKPGNSKNSQQIENITDITVSENKMEGKSNEQHPQMEKSEETKSVVVSDDKSVPGKEAREREYRKENDTNDTVGTRGSRNEPNIHKSGNKLL